MAAPSASRSGFVPVDAPHVAVAADGTLAAVHEAARVTILALPGGAAFAQIGVDPDATASEIAWVGTPGRLIVLARYEAHSTVHLLDPHGPRTIAEIRLEQPMRLMASVGATALVVGSRGAAVLAASDTHLTLYPFPTRAVPLAAGAAATQIMVALPGSIEEWDPRSRLPKRRLRLPRVAAITAVGGSERLVWMTTRDEPARVDVIPLINRGQPRAHDLPEPIARTAGHPRSDLLVCVGAESGKLYVLDLDGRAPGYVTSADGLDRIESAGLVVGRAASVLVAQARRPIAIVALSRRDSAASVPHDEPVAPSSARPDAPAAPPASRSAGGASPLRPDDDTIEPSLGEGDEPPADASDDQRPSGDALDESGPSGDALDESGPSGDAPGDPGPSGDALDESGPSGHAPGDPGPSGDALDESGPSGDALDESGPSGDAPGEPRSGHASDEPRSGHASDEPELPSHAPHEPPPPRAPGWSALRHRSSLAPHEQATSPAVRSLSLHEPTGPIRSISLSDEPAPPPTPPQPARPGALLRRGPAVAVTSDLGAKPSDSASERFSAWRDLVRQHQPRIEASASLDSAPLEHLDDASEPAAVAPSFDADSASRSDADTSHASSAGASFRMNAAATRAADAAASARAPRFDHSPALRDVAAHEEPEDAAASAGAPRFDDSPARRDVAAHDDAAPLVPARDDAMSWRDELIVWTRTGAVAGEAPTVRAIEALVARFELAPRLERVIARIYGAHLCGEPGVAPVDVAHVLDRQWDEALGRGELAQHGLVSYASSRVALSPAVQRMLDELPPITGTLVGTPGAVALLGACVVVAGHEPLPEIAARCLDRVGGAVLAAHPEADPTTLAFEARVYGAAPMRRASSVDRTSRDPLIIVVDDAQLADDLGVPRLA